MHRLVRVVPIALLGGLLVSSAAAADSPVLSNRCVNDPSLCSGGDGHLETGSVRIRPVSALDRADGGSIVLTNRDLELSTDELSDRTAEAAPPPAPVAVAAKTPESDAADTAGAAEAEPEADAAVVAPAPQPQVAASEFSADEHAVGGIEPGVDFSACMERSIRAGNAFDESRRVCAAVFPE